MFIKHSKRHNMQGEIPGMTAAACLIACLSIYEAVQSSTILNSLNGGNSAYLRLISCTPLLSSFRADLSALDIVVGISVLSRVCQEQTYTCRIFLLHC